jgi:glycosyltransferase involved in cell wall biosynthesis
METHELPLVSVVTPSLNQVRFLEQAIESVAAQDYPHLEHIVVDGGSDDGTIDVLRHHHHLRWLSERDRGQADALNKGFAIARGEIFGWLNADDMYLPDAVSTAVAALRTSGAGLVYGGIRVLQENGDVEFEVEARPWDYETLLDARNFVPQPAAFFTRQAFESVGGLDLRYHYVLDYDLWLRMGARFPVQQIERVLACFRFQSESKSAVSLSEFFPEAHKASRRAGGRYFSRAYMERFPQRHPHLFRALLLGRQARSGDLAGLVRTLTRGIESRVRARFRARGRVH